MGNYFQTTSAVVASESTPNATTIMEKPSPELIEDRLTKLKECAFAMVAAKLYAKEAKLPMDTPQLIEWVGKHSTQDAALDEYIRQHVVDRPEHVEEALQKLLQLLTVQ